MAKTKYYKVTDIEENIFSLIEDGATVKVASRNKAAKRVTINEVPSFSSRDYNGIVKEISEKEFKDTLKDWGFKKPEPPKPTEEEIEAAKAAKEKAEAEAVAKKQKASEAAKAGAITKAKNLANAKKKAEAKKN